MVYKRLKSIPKFKNEEEEYEFWMKHDSTEYIDWSKAERGLKLPNLKPSRETISLRMPSYLLDDIKIAANKRDVPYQSYMKMLLYDKIKEEKAKYNTRKHRKRE